MSAGVVSIISCRGSSLRPNRGETSLWRLNSIRPPDNNEMSQLYKGGLAGQGDVDCFLLARACNEWVKQWLERVVVVAVNQGHSNRDVGQLLSQAQPTKSRSDNNDVGIVTHDIFMAFVPAT